MRALFVAALAVAIPTLVSGQRSEVILAADLVTHLDPIARLDGSTWRAVPAAGLGRLAPTQWTRWYAQGTSRSIRLGVAEPTGRCSAPGRLPIASPPPAPQGVFDRTFVGIAATGPLAVDSLKRINATAPEWKPITAAIVPIFNRRAQATGVSATLLARVPMTVDWVFAASSGGEAPTYYFEASKRIPDAGDTPSEDPRGVVRIAASGWLRAAGGGFVPAGTAGEFAWEPEGEEESSPPGQLPLGVLRHGDDRVWVMKGRVGIRDTFTLYALGAGGVRTLFTVDAAAC